MPDQHQLVSHEEVLGRVPRPILVFDGLPTEEVAAHNAAVLNRGFADRDRLVLQMELYYKAPFSVVRRGTNELGVESEDDAAFAVLGDVSFRRRGVQGARTGSERVFLGAKSVVRRNDTLDVDFFVTSERNVLLKGDAVGLVVPPCEGVASSNQHLASENIDRLADGQVLPLVAGLRRDASIDGEFRPLEQLRESIPTVVVLRLGPHYLHSIVGQVVEQSAGHSKQAGQDSTVTDNENPAPMAAVSPDESNLSPHLKYCTSP